MAQRCPGAGRQAAAAPRRARKALPAGRHGGRRVPRRRGRFGGGGGRMAAGGPGGMESGEGGPARTGKGLRRAVPAAPCMRLAAAAPRTPPPSPQDRLGRLSAACMRPAAGGGGALGLRPCARHARAWGRRGARHAYIRISARCAVGLHVDSGRRCRCGCRRCGRGGAAARACGRRGAGAVDQLYVWGAGA